MRFIERADLNLAKWDVLANSDIEASFFSYSWYLDAVAENWCVLTDENYSKGIALPYSKRVGVEILYVPIFGRYSHAFGNLSASDLEMITNRFKVREFATTSAVLGNEEDRVHQIIADFDNRKLSSQAKRSLKKAEKSKIVLTENESYAEVFSAIQKELEGKFQGVDADRLSRLETLFANAQKEGMLKVFEVTDGQEAGGIVCLVNHDQVLYLKGACPENLKRNGGMYLALNCAIEFAQSHNAVFDFGGSNVEGVKRFNTNLGGVDKKYYYHEANDAPFWFQWARKIKNRSKR
ncbi:MAG: hypothetical protein Crog4KO_14100 [Crocinitomicaceae bacterium]